MKRHPNLAQSVQQRLRRGLRRRQHDDRRGSTLLVVIALLGMLMLLGMVYYTYPDLNNMFLAYDGYTSDVLNPTPPTRIRVIKPSFHRPELLRDFSGAAPYQPLTNWATASGTNTTKRLLFRPHPEHLYVWRQ